MGYAGLLWGCWRLCTWLGGLLPPQAHAAGQQNLQGRPPDIGPTKPGRYPWGSVHHAGKESLSHTGWCKAWVGQEVECKLNRGRFYKCFMEAVSPVTGAADTERGAGVWDLPQGLVGAALHHWSYWQVMHHLFNITLEGLLYDSSQEAKAGSPATQVWLPPVVFCCISSAQPTIPSCLSQSIKSINMQKQLFEKSAKKIKKEAKTDWKRKWI